MQLKTEKKKRRLWVKVSMGLGGAAAAGIIAFAGYIGFLTVADQYHEPVEVLSSSNKQASQMSVEQSFSLMTYNIGYAGLDKAQDFFADGGKSGRSASLEATLANLNRSIDTIKTSQVDFVYLQEVDTNALRSYQVDEYQLITKALPSYESVFAYNYNAHWVPVPLTQPMGYVNAGMTTLSAYKTAESKRHQLEGQEAWPMSVMELDRCFIETRVPVSNGKDLVLINLHLSAYDKGGLLRNKQVNHLIRVMNDLYAQGHYVVLGGDWNQLLSNEQEKDPEFMAKWPSWLVKIPAALEETGYQWAIDESVNTVRDLATAYEPGNTFETIIDGFLVSPNLKIERVKGLDLDFENSDHNPVICVLKFK